MRRRCVLGEEDSEVVWNRLRGMTAWRPALMNAEACMVVLMRKSSRLTLNQALAFVYVARALTESQHVNLKDARLYMEDVQGKATSTAFTTLNIFFKSKDGLGWIEYRESLQDRRRKHLALTHEGELIAEQMFEAAEAVREKG